MKFVFVKIFYVVNLMLDSIKSGFKIGILKEDRKLLCGLEVFELK